jgi:AAA15 family ATPase/GTPase
MQLIEKIELKYFRSFGEKNVKITDLKDLNVFSGSNDVGKSNLLKALNLFFNDEININEKFDFKKDLSFLQKIRSDNKLEEKKKTRTKEQPNPSQRDLFVRIKVFFNRDVPDSKSTTPNKFWVEKTWDKNGFNKRSSNIHTAYKKKNKRNPTQSQAAALQGQLTQFLNSINFEYIPAVKDRQFLQYLFKKLQKSLFERDNTFAETSNEINNRIADTTKDLFLEFKEKTGIDAEFSIPGSLIDFFTTINVSTENGISLYSRGDGMQARFIPAILNEIYKGKKNIIWGFEEPENSFEYRNAELLANDFLNNYSDDKQIFITSHTKEFLSLIKDNEEKVSLHRVYKTIKKGSLVDTYKKNKGFNKKEIQKSFWEEASSTEKEANKDILNKIFEDIGFLESDQFIVEDLQNQLKNQRSILEESGLEIGKQKKINEQLTQKIKQAILGDEALKKEIEEYKKPILYVEDTLVQLYKISYLKIKDIKCTEGDYEALFKEKAPFLIYGKGSANELNKQLDIVGISDFEEKKVIGLFDFDKAYNQFNGLNKERWGDIKGTEKEGLYKKRNKHECFYAMILPVPNHRKSYASKKVGGDSKLSIELYFTDETLKKLKHFDEENVPGVSEKRVKFVGKKANFWKKLFKLNKPDFSNFETLFEIILKLFQFPPKNSEISKNWMHNEELRKNASER